MWTWECCNGLSYGRYCWWKQLLFAAERWSALEHRKALELLWQYLWPEVSAITKHTDREWLPLHEETLFLLCGEVPRHSISHSATSKPVLQASTPKQKFYRFFTISSIIHHEYVLHSWLSVKQTKPVKAPTYTRTLPDIGNEECVSTLIEHSAQVL